MQLKNRKALVFGGARGIGAAIVQRLAEEGADVAFTWRESVRSAEGVSARVRELNRKPFSIRADSADAAAVRSAVEKAAEHFGGIDILVNNAGIFPYGTPESFSVDEIDQAFAIHARAPFIATQAAVPHLSDGGRIISIGSCFVQRVPVPGISLYAMTKAALTGMTRALARDLGPRDITVNVVHPGPTDTDMNPADDDGADEERALTALGRYGRPEEIADTVAFLVGNGGRYLTGTEIAVDGGYAA